MLSAWANQATLRAPLSQPDPSGYFISPMKRLKTWARAACHEIATIQGYK